MNKKIRISLIIVAVISWLVGIPAMLPLLMLFAYIEDVNTPIGGIVQMTFLFVIGLVLLIIMANWIASYICHRMKREYHSVAVPDAEDADSYPELKPFFEMMNAQQREIEHQLARVAKEKNRLSTIINNMDEGLIILDNDLNVIMLNHSAYSWLGSELQRSECAGKHISKVCTSREICEAIERADYTNLTIGGRHLQLHVNHVVSSAEQVGRIGLLLDVTERTEIDRIKQEFTANVSHELKTPLTSISGYAELIGSGMAKGDDAQDFAGRIHRESTRLLALISDIIKLSRLDEGTDTENFERVDLLSVARECKDVLEISAGRNDISLKITGKSCYVRGSHSQLTELIYNLIDNGIRYNHPGGEVNVTVGEDHTDGIRTAVVAVSDTGIGIAKEHQSRVFERFYRVDKSRSKETGGTGLGLAIVKHVAERHGAKLELESSVGKGSTIRIIFGKTTDN